LHDREKREGVHITPFKGRGRASSSKKKKPPVQGKACSAEQMLTIVERRGEKREENPGKGESPFVLIKGNFLPHRKRPTPGESMLNPIGKKQGGRASSRGGSCSFSLRGK